MTGIETFAQNDAAAYGKVFAIRQSTDEWHVNRNPMKGNSIQMENISNHLTGKMRAIPKS